MGIMQVDLLGKTYEGVTFEGHLVQDPFEVIEAKQDGPARKLPVLEVISALWVKRVENGVRVLRQGKVCC
jgi:hypothetical protein